MTAVPSFPRGFILTTRAIGPPPTFETGPILENLHIHPWTHVEHAGDTDQFVIILGTCTPTDRWDTDRPADRLLTALRASESTLLITLDEYAGRHVVIFGSASTPKVVADATAMRSVFYAEQGGVVSSHALLVERALGGEPERDPMPFRYGFPGNRTPYTRTRLLTPNTYYDVAQNQVRRFWPVIEPRPRSVESVAVEILERASEALRRIARERPVKIALTAGLDSRVMLATALHSGIEFETYTYGGQKDTAMDRAFAADLADDFGIPHAVPPKASNEAALRDHLAEAHFTTMHGPIVRTLMQWFSDPSAAAVSANLLEIGRSYYARLRDRGDAEPYTAEAMAALHHYSAGTRTREEIEEYGEAEFFQRSEASFQEFIDDTDYLYAAGRLDAFDLFYWEYRMSAWHGAAMVERDFYGEAFIPFNSRRTFEALLGVPQADRDTAAVFHRLIEMVDPRLLDKPINPKEWPLPVS